MPTKRTMSAANFEAVRPLLKISAARIDAARAVLVDGKTLQAVAIAHGWKARQTVSDCVDAVCEAFTRWQQSQQAAESFRTHAAQERAGQPLTPANMETLGVAAPIAHHDRSGKQGQR
jgi:hypothetical protein